MSIWSTIKSLFQPQYHIEFTVDDALEMIQGQSAAELYKTQPHLRTVIGFLADNVAQIKLKEFQRVSDTDRQRVTDAPLINLLRQPNATMTGYELIRQLAADLALYDNAYWLVYQNPGRDVERFASWEIRPIPPTWVVAKSDGSAFAPKTYRIHAPMGGQTQDVPASSMLVFHGWNPTDPVAGTSPIKALKDVLNEQIQAWSFRTQMWKRGGRIGMYVSRPKDAPNWDETARERFKRGWKDFQDKGARAGESPVLEDGMELKRVGFTAREEEFMEVTKLSLQTVAQVYHVPPTMVGDLDNANFSNTREFRKMLYSETLGPTLRMIEDRLNTFLAPMLGTDVDDYLEFDVHSKLSGDFEEMASVLSTSVGAPWITPNEARATQNLPRIDGGDQLVVPLNVTQGGQASPQDGGKPKRPATGTDSDEAKQVIAAWKTRMEKSVRSKLGAGISPDDIDWKKWQDELQADLVVKANVNQYAAGITALQQTTEMRKKLEKEATIANQTTGL
ncbi:phage portal protein [Bifidobacterium sp. ESL0775]|uniref:phage portal protein n=1 Tax=Bifidobacterium sp. ESL0775 TaxID=2983230 RepID=UPI0023F77FFA|nr:phage portal protein [Bifidobacterium sp. ESL0775]WEV68725.1 phage portal protein [Bifidobacterium sp. ESL0775]